MQVTAVTLERAERRNQLIEWGRVLLSPDASFEAKGLAAGNLILVVAWLEERIEQLERRALQNSAQVDAKPAPSQEVKP